MDVIGLVQIFAKRTGRFWRPVRNYLGCCKARNQGALIPAGFLEMMAA